MSASPRTAKLDAEIVETTEALPAWKQEINARLSAHRTRRGAFTRQAALPGMEPPAASEARAARVAARVAARYAQAPTYSEVLAAEAAKAARAAEAAAEAARQAHEAAQAVTEVLWAGLESEPEFELKSETAPHPVPEAPVGEAIASSVQYHVNPASLPAARRSALSSATVQAHSVDPHPHVEDPFEEAVVAPAQPLPARVIEFPRELVAPRKARPRYAEGPLREESDAAQLRIFEVEPETISHQPPSAAPEPEEAVLPEWSSIRLDAAPSALDRELGTTAASAKTSRTRTQSRNQSSSQSSSGSSAAPFSSRAQSSALANLLPLQVAPLEDRLMAAIVDAVLVLFAFLLFVLVFVACTPHPPMGKPAMVAAAAALAGFGLLYQWLFFSFAEGTPGMRYAKIALCTFDDENPGRRVLQRRVGACFLAVLPLCLGFLWTLLDDDRLGWHDRMTRTYQRSYR